MEEPIKYYTPDISDLRVGYECEEPVPDYSSTGPPKKWKKIVIGEGDTYRCSIRERQTVYLPFPEFIRTAYLTKEQIEAEGWKCYKTEEPELQFQGKSDGNSWWELDYDTDLHHLTVAYWKASPLGGSDCLTYFEGSCPSINEFRTIQKLLGII